MVRIMNSVIKQAIDSLDYFIINECGLETSLKVSRDFPDYTNIVVYSSGGTEFAEIIPSKTHPFKGMVGMIEAKINSCTLRIRLIKVDSSYYWEGSEDFLEKLKSNLIKFDCGLRNDFGI